MDGLIIKKEWLDLILCGKKTLEIRGHDTKKINQSIYLLESGSHKVRAICKIKRSTLMTYQNWDEYKEQTCLDLSFIGLNKWYHTAYAWEIAELEPIEDIWYYSHPKGAVIWVKNVVPLDEMQDERLRFGF